MRCGSCAACLEATRRELDEAAPCRVLAPLGERPTTEALEKHARRFGPEGVVETALEFGLDVDVSAAPVRRPRRRRR